MLVNLYISLQIMWQTIKGKLKIVVQIVVKCFFFFFFLPEIFKKFIEREAEDRRVRRIAKEKKAIGS